MNFQNGSSYLSAIYKPPLPEDKLIKYFELLGNGYIEYKELLIEHNMRLVISIATGKFKNVAIENVYLDVDDLISTGTIGLIKAINTFDLNKKLKFSTYASRCIENEMLASLRKVKKLKTNVSFDTTLNIDKNGNVITIGDTLTTDQNIEEECIRKITKEKIRESLYLLKELEQEIIKLRYGLNSIYDNGMSQKEVAKMLGYSHSYISKIELGAIKKIANLLKGNRLATYKKLLYEKSQIQDSNNNNLKNDLSSPIEDNIKVKTL